MNMVNDCVLEICCNVKLLVRNNWLALISQMEFLNHITWSIRGIPCHLFLVFLSAQEAAKERIRQLDLFSLFLLMHVVNFFIIIKYKGPVISCLVNTWPVLFQYTIQILVWWVVGSWRELRAHVASRMITADLVQWLLLWLHHLIDRVLQRWICNSSTVFVLASLWASRTRPWAHPARYRVLGDVGNIEGKAWAFAGM